MDFIMSNLLKSVQSNGTQKCLVREEEKEKFFPILLCASVLLSSIRFIGCQVVVIYFNHMFQTFLRDNLAC